MTKVRLAESGVFGRPHVLARNRENPTHEPTRGASGAVLVALLLAGCLGGLEGDAGDGESENSETVRPTDIVDWTSEKGDVETTIAPAQEPYIGVNRDEATVTLRGRSPAGNECGYLEIQESRYDAEHSRLGIGLEDGTEDPEYGDERESKSYRVQVAFDQGIPATIEVQEPSATAREEFV